MRSSALSLVPAALLLVAGCTEILNIDVTYDNGAGGGGAVPSTGGDGGSGAGSTVGGNGAGPTTGGSGGESSGGSSPYCTAADEFSIDGDPDLASCWYAAHGSYVTTSVSGDELHVLPNGAGSTTGWYDADEGYYLYRHLSPGPFAVVTKVRVTNRDDDGEPSAVSPNAYHVAGFVVRDPLAAGARWVKLEVGYRADTASFGNNPFGTLAAVTASSTTTHVTPYDMDEDLEVELGICRDENDEILLFVRNEPDGLFQQEEGSALDGFQIAQGAEVGVTATAYTGPQFDVSGHFDYVRFAEDAAVASAGDCLDIITSLADQSPDGSCGCTDQDER